MRRRQELTSYGISEHEIIIELKHDWFTKPIKTLEQLNDESVRLNMFHEDARYLNLHYSYSGDLECDLLLEYGRYFYRENYADLLTRKEPDVEEIKDLQDREAMLEKAYKGILDLLPFLEEQQEATQGEAEEEKYIQLLAEMNILKREIANNTVESGYDYGFSERDEPVILRKDKTARERTLAYNLWSSVRYDGVRKNPVTTICYLLQIEGIENSIDQRTIERWLQSWRKR